MLAGLYVASAYVMAATNSRGAHCRDRQSALERAIALVVRILLEPVAAMADGIRCERRLGDAFDSGFRSGFDLAAVLAKLLGSTWAIAMRYWRGRFSVRWREAAGP